MKQQHVSCEEGGAEEYKLHKDILKDLELLCKSIFLSPTDRLFSRSRKCQSCLQTKRGWPLRTSSYWAVLVALSN